MMPEFSNKIFSSSNEMCKTILKDTGVALLPGSDLFMKYYVYQNKDLYGKVVKL